MESQSERFAALIFIYPTINLGLPIFKRTTPFALNWNNLTPPTGFGKSINNIPTQVNYTLYLRINQQENPIQKRLT